MSNKEREMKNMKYGITFVIILACVILFTACDTIADTPEIQVENGYGRISISFEGEEAVSQTATSSMARTVLPLTVFDKYVYTFTKAGEGSGVVKTPGNDGFFTLEVGNYTVAVQAYIGTAEPYTLAASGVSPQFSVGSGSNALIRVPLSGVNTVAQGKFIYTITYPADATAKITLQRWPELVNTTLNPVNITQGNGKTQTLELGTGTYLLTVLISKNELYAGTSEAVHINPFLTSVYTKDFVDNDFLSLPIIPTAYPPAGTYTTAQNITLTTPTARAAIYYTLNGSTPTASSAKYNSPIVITQTTTLKAITIIDGLNSEILTTIYTLSPVTPTASPTAGTYATVQNVALSTTTAGAAIRYTLNGDTPTTSSTQYTSPIIINQTTTIKAIAIKEGLNSGILTAIYTIIPPVTPIASPSAGTYATAQNITLSTTTAGAIIRYTLNGDTPTETSAQYTGPIAISHSTTLKAVAIKDGLNSGILTAVYRIPRTYTESVQRVTFTGSTATVNLDYLYSNDIYLVKVNTSNSVVSAANTGGFLGSSPNLLPNIQSDEYTPEMELPRMGHPDADAFNANPPPIVDAGPRRSRAVFIPPVVGDTRMFWVESYYHSGTWVQKQATLRATGQYGNIWIMDENFGSGGNKITSAQAQTLAAKFDLIYPIETNLLDFEYGGGPGGNGGKDGDPKVQILVYDIVDASGKVQAAGFFHSKDFYEQSQLSTQKTNLAEIFYIDAGSVINSPDYIYSTLAHEFQHMINFNVKYVKQGKNSESWYNEMLSMMTEDVMASHINDLIIPDSNNKVMQRVRTFLTNYEKVGITEWNTLENISYAKGMSFGAYLLRNYGGASLLKEMLANNSTNIASVTAALRTVNGNSVSFEEALRRFGEAMVFSGAMPVDVLSFDKTVEKTIGSYTYIAKKFNIWSDFGSTKPKIFGVNEQVELRPYSLTVHQGSAATWKNQSGNVTITLQRPNDPNVELYLMVK